MQVLKAHVTRVDYLEFDAASPDRHEFLDGHIFAMSGGSFNHATIGLNIATILRNQLRGSPCQPMNSDMRIHTPSGLDTYPDVSVFYNKAALTDDNRTLLNPVLIVEVLSPSTRSYDRGDKFWHYRSIPHLQDYVLIDSESIHIEHHQRRNRDEWLLHEYRRLEDTLHLASLGLTLTVAGFYEDVTFSPAG
ncbi:MAG TPA: Uma2 family endonuclease [Thiolinea sp.]|nr:Uma2 family endonuclease [Thiolinea sp.]